MKRITFKQLNILMNKISDSKYFLENLKQEIESFRQENNQFMIKDHLKYGNKSIETKLANLENQNLKINNDLKGLKNILAQYEERLKGNAIYIKLYKTIVGVKYTARL